MLNATSQASKAAGHIKEGHRQALRELFLFVDPSHTEGILDELGLAYLLDLLWFPNARRAARALLAEVSEVLQFASLLKRSTTSAADSGAGDADPGSKGGAVGISNITAIELLQALQFTASVSAASTDSRTTEIATNRKAPPAILLSSFASHFLDLCTVCYGRSPASMGANSNACSENGKVNLSAIDRVLDIADLYIQPGSLERAILQQASAPGGATPTAAAAAAQTADYALNALAATRDSISSRLSGAGSISIGDFLTALHRSTITSRLRGVFHPNRETARRRRILEQQHIQALFHELDVLQRGTITVNDFEQIVKACEEEENPSISLKVSEWWTTLFGKPARYIIQ